MASSGSSSSPTKRGRSHHQQQQQMKGSSSPKKAPRAFGIEEDDPLTSSPSSSSSSASSHFMSLPMMIMVVALAIGMSVGFAHQSRGLDLAGTITTFLHGDPTPSMAPRLQPEQKGSSSQKGSSGNNKSMGLTGPVKVHVCRNGESTPVASLTVKPEKVRCIEDLRRVIGKKIAPAECKKGNCRVFNQNGYEIKSLGMLEEDQLLFTVLPNRHFIWPAFHVGYKTEVPGVTSASPNKPMTLETLSDSPRVFMVENFFSEQDADDLINNALTITAEGFALKRSTTGAKGAEISTHRTSENAFDTVSPVAMKLKRRVFDLLGMRPYVETWADGLQVLRYNKSKAYIPHLDYLETTPGANHDFDSSVDGTNRFATVLLYLTDVEKGGETVFLHGESLTNKDMSIEDAEKKAKALGLVDALTPDSWEAKMMTQCVGRLAVKPKKARAVLFYSQLADGRVDENSLHGSCPVVEGTKWAANLWVWNGPRFGYRPKNKQMDAAVAQDQEAYQEDNDKVEAEFISAVPGVSLFWQDTPWGEMGPDKQPIRANTYIGHTWRLKRTSDGVVVHTFTVTQDDAKQRGTVPYHYNG